MVVWPLPTLDVVDTVLVPPTHVGHVGLLYSDRTDCTRVARVLHKFYSRQLGLRIEYYPMDAKDRGSDAQPGSRRFYIMAGQTLVLVYSPVRCDARTLRREFYKKSGFHVCLPLNVRHLDRIRALSDFERETKWGVAKRSVFLNGPWGLELELQHARGQEG